MRQIGTIDTDMGADAFSDYLLAQGIPNMVEEDAEGKWSVWVENDDHLDRAKAELAAFAQSPDDVRYIKAAKVAGVVRKTEEKKQERLKKQFVNVRTRWSQPQQWRVPLTLTLILTSVVVTMGTHFGENEGSTEKVTFGSWASFKVGFSKLSVEDAVRLNEFQRGALPTSTSNFLRDRWLYGVLSSTDIRHGEVWRIFSPIFLHLSFIHLLFNMFWIRDLGGMIERKRGTLMLAILVVVSAVVSNVSQAAWSGPLGGGMSGVVYALFGYVWMRGRYFPELGIGLAPQTVVFMLAWLVLCMTGTLGPIGNAAHLMGLVVGVIIGYLPVLRRKMGRLASTRFL